MSASHIKINGVLISAAQARQYLSDLGDGLAWQTVTPNVDGTTAIAINWLSGQNVKLDTIKGALQPISAPTNMPDGATMKIRVRGGAFGSGDWSAYTFPAGSAPTVSTLTTDVVVVFVERVGTTYICYVGAFIEPFVA